MKRAFTLITATLISLLIGIRAAAPTEPDFAYPEKVSKEADSKLKTALKQHNGQEIVRAIMNYSLAESAIDTDRLPQILERMTKISDEVRNDSVTHAMMSMLQAQVYFDIYIRDRWKYDKRELPAYPLAADCREWSGQQFRACIDSLIGQALQPVTALRNTAIGSWKDVVTVNKVSEPCFPTLYDFMAYKAISFYITTKNGNNSSIELLNTIITHSSTYPAAQIYGHVRLMNLQPAANEWKAAKALLARYEHEPYSALIIQRMADMASGISLRKWLYGVTEQWLNTHKAAQADLRKGMLTVKHNLIRAKAEVEFARAISPDTPLKVKIHAECTNSCRLLVYSLPVGWTANKASMYTQISSTQVKLAGSGVFERDTTVAVNLPGYGCYAIVPVMTTQDIKNARINDNKIVSVTSLGLMGTSFGKRTQIIVADATTGAPVKGATVNVAKTRREQAARSITDRRGISEFTRHFDYGNTITASLGKDTRTPAMHVWNYMPGNDSDDQRIDARLYTSLAIYRPGDKVDFAGVIYTSSTKTDTRHVASGLKTRAVLNDANYQPIDTIELTTDEYGRIEATFTLPKDGRLTGQFGIRLYTDTRNVSNVYFTVSDYKMPTFEVTTPAIERGVPAKGDVRISAMARTYSGFPLEGARVTVELRASDEMNRWWWYHDDGRSFHTQDIVAGKDGKFTFEFSDSLLNSAPGQHQLFTAKITVTAANGETQSAEARFSQGKQYCILQSLPSNIAIQGATLKLPVKVIDLQGNDVALKLRYTVRRDSTAISSGEINSANPIIEATSIPSGKYDITISPVDSALANTVTADNIVLYRTTDKLCPVDEALWIPQTGRITAQKGGKASILYGTSANDLNMLCTIWTNDSILSQKWIHASKGMHNLEVDIPAKFGHPTVNMTLLAINGYKNYRQEVAIEVTDVADHLNIEIESMRDRITPGSTERWTIRVTDNCDTKRVAALMMRMYATALDKLATNPWMLVPVGGRAAPFNNFSSNIGNIQNSWIIAPLNGSNSYIDITQPALQTYGMRFGSQYGYGKLGGTMIRGSRMMANTAMMKMDYAAEGAVMEEAVATGAIESADSGAAETEADDAASEAKAADATIDNEYRLPEVPLAFFRPMLTTNADGVLEFSFTAPQANTMWTLQAIGFTDDMLSGRYTHNLTASKPVMVQPSLPRFLRSGDSAVVKATVMNNTDRAITADVIIEVFDGFSGETISQSKQECAMDSMASATVTAKMTATQGLTAIGYRIKASANGYTDGEQSIIPVLPSTSQLIETKPFYMAPGDNTLTVKLPKMKNGASVKLEFCENPAWYCVTALPGLRADDARSALSASAAIFSAAVASGIMHDQPEVAQAIRYWTQSDRSDSTLVSMLQRNADLKTVLLNSTPWASDARNDSERMTRLALLFDPNEINDCYDSNIALLTKLEHNGGGWSWTERADKPSEWITCRVLGTMGRLKQLGYMPDNAKLNDMVTRAIKYMDRTVGEQYAEYPKGDYSDYAYMRSYYPNIKATGNARKAIESTVNNIGKNWKKMSVAGKAASAILLQRHGKASEARNVMESLRQYSTSTAERGMWWPSLDSYTGWAMGKVGATALILDAYATVLPGNAAIDPIRQWLILQKEAENWGTGITTTDVIASILSTGSRWTVPANGAEIRLGNKQLRPLNATDSLTGYMTIPLDDASGKELTITKQAAGPAWGAVYSRFTQTTYDVKAAGCNAVKIDKRMLVARNTPNGVEWREVKNGVTLKVGDRVKVMLTITSTRDMDYVAITDERAAALEPVEQTPTPLYSEGLCFYRENRDASTRIMIDHMPKGRYLLNYEMWINNAGQYCSGVASLQSQYAPQLAAHSSGSMLSVAE